MNKEEELAYWAGFLDGEGWIGIGRSFVKDHPRVRVCYRLVAGLVNTNEDIMERFTTRFGGYLYLRKATENHKPTWDTHTTGETAYNILKILLPYFIVKRKQAEVAIEYYEKTHPAPRGRRLTKDELELREIYYQKMKILNKRGV